MKQIIGYTAGVYDLFHIGHLNLLKNAKGLCDKLIVGISTDDLVKKKNGKGSTIPYEDRCEIVRSIKYVDAVIPQEEFDKVEICKKLKANYLFVGDDWYDSERFNNLEKELEKEGIKVIYFPYTKKISSTKIRKKMEEKK